MKNKLVYYVLYIAIPVIIFPNFCFSQENENTKYNFYLKIGVSYSFVNIKYNLVNKEYFLFNNTSIGKFISMGNEIFLHKNTGINIGIQLSDYTYYAKNKPFTLELFEQSYTEFWFNYFNVALPINFLYRKNLKNGSSIHFNIGTGVSTNFLWVATDHRSLYAPNNTANYLLGIGSETIISFMPKYSMDAFGSIVYYFPHTLQRRFNIAIGLDFQQKFTETPTSTAIAQVGNIDKNIYQTYETLIGGKCPAFFNFYLQLGLKNKKK